LFTAPPAGAVTFTENFSSNPLANGWQIFGDTNLFIWNVTNQNLEVTWDSSQPNSYFFHPLGTILAEDDNFSLSFDLNFRDYAAGTSANKPYAFEAALGFLNLQQAMQTNFLRGTGINATYGPVNLVEFDFFPAFYVFKPTMAQVIVATNNAWLYNHDNLLGMTPGDWFHVEMDYDGGARTLTTVTTSGGVQYGQTQIIEVPDNFEFRANAVSISSYSDQRANSSILAHGVVANISVTVPPPPVQNLSAGFAQGVWQARFCGRTNWLYTLERAVDFQAWTNAASAGAGDGTNYFLQDTNPPANQAFYRVKAERP
jgi:regulation of enolase protein 1 (concanavalin A-like superfamily)